MKTFRLGLFSESGIRLIRKIKARDSLTAKNTYIKLLVREKLINIIYWDNKNKLYNKYETVDEIVN